MSTFAEEQMSKAKTIELRNKHIGWVSCISFARQHDRLIELSTANRASCSTSPVRWRSSAARVSTCSTRKERAISTASTMWRRVRQKIIKLHRVDFRFYRPRFIFVRPSLSYLRSTSFSALSLSCNCLLSVIFLLSSPRWAIGQKWRKSPRRLIYKYLPIGNYVALRDHSRSKRENLMRAVCWLIMTHNGASLSCVFFDWKISFSVDAL